MFVAELELEIPKADLVVAEVLGKETSFHAILSAPTILVSVSSPPNGRLSCATIRRRTTCWIPWQKSW
jgi:hypothetical protein